VTVALAADGTGASVLLDQRRLLPPGVDTPATPTWKTPVTLRYAVKGRTFHQRLWLTSAHTVCRLPVAARSLDYLTVNDGMAGYYRVLYRGDLLARLLRCRTRLTGEERLGLLQDLAAVAKAGAVPEAELLLLVADLAGDPDPRVVAVAANLAEGLDGYLVPDGSRANYVRFLQDRFGGKARSLGFFPRAGENDDTRVLRKALLGLVALGGEDTGLRSTARELALKWLGKEQTLDPTLVDVVLKIAARTGDRDLYDRFKAAARAAQDHGEQQRLLLAMASFDDPGVEKAALAELLADDFDPRQTFEMLQPGARKPATRALVLAFVQDHFEAIVARLPRSFAAKLPLEVGSALADAKDREDLKACFQERIAPFPAGTLNLDKVLETITLAEAEKLNQQASAAAFLETWVAPR
jgi:alanyl aminopeptidase